MVEQYRIESPVPEVLTATAPQVLCHAAARAMARRLGGPWPQVLNTHDFLVDRLGLQWVYRTGPWMSPQTVGAKVLEGYYGVEAARAILKTAPGVIVFDAESRFPGIAIDPARVRGLDVWAITEAMRLNGLMQEED